jgi:benzoyl-CoA reductase/2-hydroxyglutaryl-CoA dehydratase subunit BcrC/BadD/HgdB
MTIFDRPAKDVINLIGQRRLRQLADRVGFEVKRNPDGSLDYLCEFKRHGFRVLIPNIPLACDIEEVWVIAESVKDSFVDANGEVCADLFEIKEYNKDGLS